MKSFKELRASLSEAAAVNTDAGVMGIKTDLKKKNPDLKLQPRTKAELDFANSHIAKKTKYPEDQDDTHASDKPQAEHQPNNGETVKTADTQGTSKLKTKVSGAVKQTPPNRGDSREGDIRIVRTSSSAVTTKTPDARKAFSQFVESMQKQRSTN